MADTIDSTVVHLIASSGFYGGEKVVANICNTIHEFPLIVVCLTDNPDEIFPFQEAVQDVYNVEFITIDKSFPHAISLLRKLSHDTAALTIHAHGYKETFIASVFRLFVRCRIIVTQHGFTSRNRKSQFYNFINKFCCRFAKVDAVISVSHSIYSTYKTFGVNPDRLHYLPNGLLLIKSQESGPRTTHAESLRSRLDLGQDVSVILFAGRLSAEKDPKLFLQVFAQLHKQHTRTHAVIAGDGPLKSELENDITLLGLQNDVSMLGFVREMTTLLHETDILVLTSVTEGVPLIVLEAMAAGTAVVAAAVGDIPFIIDSGHNGITVQSRKAATFAKHCQKLLQDKALYKSLTTKGIQTIQQNYNMMQQKDFYLKLYGKEFT